MTIKSAACMFFIPFQIKIMIGLMGTFFIEGQILIGLKVTLQLPYYYIQALGYGYQGYNATYASCLFWYIKFNELILLLALSL